MIRFYPFVCHVIALCLSSVPLLTLAQTHNIILGRPTDVSVTASIFFDYQADHYIEYGTSPGNYSATLPTLTNVAWTPDEVLISGLVPDTRYYYRMRYRPSGTGPFAATAEYDFMTQRASGSTFTFTIEADEHLYDKKGVDNLYRITLANQKADEPDFMISLGDIFGDDHEPTTTTLADMDSLHYAYRPFLGEICPSVPFYVCLGNHEGENDYYLDSVPPYNIGVSGTLTRKKYYPNPYPDGFYTGNTTPEGFGMDLPENYFAFTWGDALFVVLDVYRTQCANTLVPKPQGWNWTLGEVQYQWLLSTLQSSTATHKFVFAHHVRGQGRGGILPAAFYEWGGIQQNSGNYTFDVNRPGWPMPIQTMFETYGVDIFFQGHDHLFAHEVLNGVTYQTVPMAADSTYEIGMLANADQFTADTLDGSGHLRVTVTPECATVDYIRAYLPADTSATQQNGEVAFSYTIGECLATAAEQETRTALVAYPVPASDRVALRIPADMTNVRVILYDMTGREVMHTQSAQLDVSGLPEGVYSLRVLADQREERTRILVAR